MHVFQNSSCSSYSRYVSTYSYQAFLNIITPTGSVSTISGKTPEVTLTSYSEVGFLCCKMKLILLVAMLC